MKTKKKFQKVRFEPVFVEILGGGQTKQMNIDLVCSSIYSSSPQIRPVLNQLKSKDQSWAELLASLDSEATPRIGHVLPIHF